MKDDSHFLSKNSKTYVLLLPLFECHYISESALFSVRLVTADYYLSKPIPELDVQFSEFRGSEVKQLPILRVFGATPRGNKTCLHIHGVFPYLYIPCDDPNPEPKIAYQIANSIDRALNISLKQANSTNQHVYKVILVQGIPFYGFHTKVHQFYKIFFYNPSFIKRVADLLQNGAILGLSYQPHEAHINFTMQFFLDFNLYGMSFINLEYIKFRRKNAQITQDKHSQLNEDEYLPETIQCTSCCEFEGDCLAQHILNRKDVIHGNLGANPGLEALWEDEKQRLNNMNMSETLVPTPTQVRDNIPPTDSHLYHGRKLLVKLALNSEMQNDSVDHSNMTLSILNDSERARSSIELTPEASKEKPSTIVSKVVYPAETPEESQILNATNVMLHHPSSRVSKKSSKCNNVLELSQTQTLSQVNLDSDDMDLMDMLKDMETNIEEDSILGTQTKPDVEEDEIEEEIRDFNERFTEEDFNVTVNEDKALSQYSVWNDTFWDNVQNISQLDGSWDVDDEQSTTSQSKRKRNLKVGLSKPKKKIPLKTKEEKNVIVLETQVQSPKKNVNMEMKIEGFKYELRSHAISPKKSPAKQLRNFKPLKITLEESPSRLEKLTTNSKIPTSETSFHVKQELGSPKSKKTLFMTKKSFDMTQQSSSDGDYDYQSISSFSDEDKSKNIKTLFQNNEFNENKIVHSPEDENSNTVSPPDYNEDNNVHKNALTASAYDRCHNYIPEAGSSRIMNILVEEKEVESLSLSPSLEDSQLDESDGGIVSFYNTTHYQDTSFADGEFIHYSPTNVSKLPSINQKSCIKEDDGAVRLHYDASFSPEGAKLRNINVTEKGMNKCSTIKDKKKITVLVPMLNPPSFNEVRSTMHEHGIPLCIHEQPFYSNPKDVGNQIEVGQIILKIKSKTLASLKPFQSDVTNSNSMEVWRENMFLTNNITQDNLNVKDLASLLASNRPCVLTPVMRPPSVQEVKNWLKAAETRNLKNEAEIPVEPEKMILYFPSSPGQDMNNSQMELSLSSSSDTSAITPSPEETIVIRKRVSIVLDEFENVNQEIKSTGKKRKNLSQPVRKLKPRSLRLSLARKLSLDSNDCTPRELSQGSNESDIVCGQQSEVNQSPTIEYSQEMLLRDIERPDPITEENIAPIDSEFINVDKSLSQTVDKSANHSTTLGFKFSGENYQDAPTIHENEYLTVIVLEVLTSTRGDMYPDPALDPILAVFYCIDNDCPEDHVLPQKESGIIITKDGHFKPEYNETAFSYLQGLNKKHKIVFVENEKLLFEEVLNLIAKWDPDILCGYEIEMQSWGFLFQRGFILDMNMASKISRVPIEEKADWKRSSQEINKDIKLIGRITLDVWRLLRHEIALTSYTFESVMYHIMHERVPQFSHKTLFFWWSHPSGLLRTLSMEYYLTRVTGVVHILQQLDLVGRTSELARLFGIQWYEVMSRGSQFRVESMMIRMTRPRNYVLVSPNMIQRAGMKAPEYLPLIMEPESRFYSDPVIVLDFQSLYPSMMIAYNYCFSTCLGKVNNMGRDTPFEFGCTQLKVSPRMLERLHKKDLIHWSPCGVGFVKPAVRKGVLPIMLQDILSTRLMVKRAMKKHKNNKTLQKILHSRQLGLKLIANVTYGYTAANFSGRMPCIEVGDSVVAKGRETLDRAIKMVENTPRWNARVVYGDTDSLFVLIPGRSRDEAFDIGAEIAEAVTNDNPTPVKLKLEKIFHPCILQTKKRYVGYMYESKDQKTPEYLAKGIETVRRDGCPAAAKMLEKTLRILFDSCDVSKVKSYVCREFQKIIEGKCNIRDFIFAKEFRGLHNYKPGASIPALEIAKQFKAQDPRKEPRDGERLPYVIVAGAPGEALLRLAHHPRDLLTDPRLRINATYYITRAIIPPLNRCLTLLGADVNLWFAELPRKQVQLYPFLDDFGNEAENKKSTISQYFAKINCAGCEVQTTGGLCHTCIQNPQSTMLILQNKMNYWQRRLNLTNKICQSCCLSTHTDCISVDCPVLFRMSTARQDAEQIPFINKMTQKLLEF